MPDGDDELTMRVGAREIYDLVKSVDAKVDALNGQKLDARITSLERWRYAIGGAYGIGIVDLFLKIKGIA